MYLCRLRYSTRFVFLVIGFRQLYLKENLVTPKKILSVIVVYEDRFKRAAIPAQRMDASRTFGELAREELLAHAHHLCHSVRENINKPGKEWKANRHFGSLQTLLSVAGWYTLTELQQHNMPDPEEQRQS
jgi:hypothetical protein